MWFVSGHRARRRVRRRGLELAAGVTACAAVIAVSLVPAIAIAARPSDPHVIAAVFPPWWSSARSVSAAGLAGRLIATGAVPWILVVRGDDGLAAHLRASGAVLLLDPRAAPGCSSVNLEPA
jgi:hypothetical protein